jgi:hypothetical protein
MGDVLKCCQRLGFPGAVLQQVPEGADRFCGDDVTGIIHVQSVLDFIFILPALNGKQRDFCAPRRQRGQKQGHAKGMVIRFSLHRVRRGGGTPGHPLATERVWPAKLSLWAYLAMHRSG